MNRSQIHKCRNWERGLAVSGNISVFWEYLIKNFRYSAYELTHIYEHLYSVGSVYFSTFLISEIVSAQCTASLLS